MRNAVCEKIVSIGVDVPHSSEQSGFLLSEHVIDCDRPPGMINLVQFWELTDKNGRPVNPIRVSGNKDALRFYVQIADSPASANAKYAPDYNRPHHEALKHKVEIRRKRMYVRIAAFGR